MVWRSILLVLGCWAMVPPMVAQGNEGLDEGVAIEAPRIEAPKIEVPKIETPKIETPKIETPKIETPIQPVPPKTISLSESDRPMEGQLEDAELGHLKLRPKALAGPETLPPENAPAVPPATLIRDDLSPTTQPPPTPLIPPNDPELGQIQTRPPESDELGKILIRPKPKPPAAAKSKSVYLLAHADYFTTANAFSAKDRISDGLIRTGATLFYAPALGPSTYLITSADANIARYTKLSQLNYNELRFRAGISQRLSPVMFGELGWSNQQLFATERGFTGTFRGDRYLNDNSLRFELSRRDRLSPKLNLVTFYQLRRSFTDRSDSDRLSNTLYASLAYKATAKLELALNYQYNRSDYISRDRATTSTRCSANSPGALPNSCKPTYSRATALGLPPTIASSSARRATRRLILGAGPSGLISC
ncbi:MAG: hypothetical protein HC860_05505 [Alkalinema sp. RU_4_3]|nr:hypothetical protein [Alkalinema sp. RU_4_3]